jgi:MFS transporter, DHA2 family, multidrug resistance protein
MSTCRSRGTAPLQPWNRRTATTRLHEAVNPTNVAATERLAKLAERFQGSDAHSQALAKMMSMVRLQAAVLSYADVFLMLTVLFLALAAFGLLMKPPQPQGAAGAADH